MTNNQPPKHLRKDIEGRNAQLQQQHNKFIRMCRKKVERELNNTEEEVE